MLSSYFHCKENDGMTGAAYLIQTFLAISPHIRRVRRLVKHRRLAFLKKKSESSTLLQSLRHFPYNENLTRAQNTISLKCCLPSNNAIDRRAKIHACLWRFRVASSKHASLQSTRFLQKQKWSDTLLQSGMYKNTTRRELTLICGCIGQVEWVVWWAGTWSIQSQHISGREYRIRSLITTYFSQNGCILSQTISYLQKIQFQVWLWNIITCITFHRQWFLWESENL